MSALTCTKDATGPAPGISDGPSVADIDGNSYSTIIIGNRVWTVENLRTTRYNDGTLIPFDSLQATWGAGTPKYCYCQNTTDADSIKKFGALYNWYTVDTKKLAPAGWHVPSSADWIMLENYLVLNGYNWDDTRDTSVYNNNKLAKSLAAKTDWAASGTSGTPGNDLTINNKSGFSALPNGYRDIGGKFSNRFFQGGWWSSTERDGDYAYFRLLKFDAANFYRTFDLKSCGFSVRLVKDY